MYLDWHHTNTRRITSYFIESIMRPKTGRETIFKEESLVVAVDAALKFIDEHFLGGK
jgi:hypothetical protein